MRERAFVRRHHPGTHCRLATVALALTLAASGSAQEAAFNASEVGRFIEGGQSYADVWGDGNFAYVAHFTQRVVTIVDITDPANPVLASTYDSGISSASAQDVKVHDGLMFVGLEGVSPGAQIVDVRDPYAPVKLTDITTMPGVHNTFYDQGWLYMADSSNNIFDIIDLRSYDPDNPPAVISESHWRLFNVGSQIVHDITVQNDRLYVSAWDTIRIYDVSNVATEEPTLLGTAPGTSVHAAWATDDGRFLIVTEEHSVSGLTLYEMSDEGNGVNLAVRDYHFLSSLRAGSVHNVLVVGNRVYASWYAAGVQVLEIDPETATWSLVASFDTTPADGDDGTFAGNWGVYPFLGEDKILGSDRGTGLWVLDVDPNILRFKYPVGLPRFVSPDTPARIDLQIDEVGAPPLASSVTLQTSVDDAPANDQTMSDLGNGFFAGTLPAAACGSVIEYSLSADNTLGATFVDPPGAPAETYRADVVTGAGVVIDDDFELEMGWTVTNAGVSAGAWLRGDPIGTGAQPENDATGSSDGSCFFTGQGVIGGSIGGADLDDGTTTLTSPPLNLSVGGGLVTYSYWLFNDDETDDLVVEVSNNGTDWVEAQRHSRLLGGWREGIFHTADFVAPGADTQVRFVIADSPNNSITEAAIDNFKVYSLSCATPIFTDGFESGDLSAWSSSTP